MTQFIVEQHHPASGWRERAASNDEAFARSVLHIFVGTAIYGRKSVYRLRDAATDEILITIGEQP